MYTGVSQPDYVYLLDNSKYSFDKQWYSAFIIATNPLVKSYKSEIYSKFVIITN